MRPYTATILLAACFGLGLLGCDNNKTVKDSPPTETTADATDSVDSAEIMGDWTLVSIDGEQALPGSSLSLKGEELSGNGGCNGYSGDYELDGATLKLGDVTSSTRACAEQDKMQQETKMLAVLRIGSKVSIDGDKLTIEGDKGTLVFEKAKPAEPRAEPALEGGTWTLDTISQGETASTPLAGTTITVRFAEGTMRGNLGCNSATAKYSAEGQNLTLTEFSITERACAGADGQDRMKQEARLSTILGQVKTYSIKDQRLTLKAGNDSLRFQHKPANP